MQIKGRNISNTFLSITTVLIVVVLTATYFYYRSVTTQSFVNGKIISLLSPIPGKVTINPRVSIGSLVRKGENLVTISSGEDNLRLSELKTSVVAFKTQLVDLRTQKKAREAMLAHRISEQDILTPSMPDQKILDIAVAEDALSEAIAQLDQAEIIKNESEKEFRRYSDLLKRDYVSQAQFEVVESKFKRAVSDHKSATVTVSRHESELHAAKLGLQSNGNRGLPYLVTRSRELSEATIDLRADIQRIERLIRAIESELTANRKELNAQKQSNIQSPVNGVVWDISVNTGGSVNRTGPLLQLVDCEDLWVEAFIDENDIDAFELGDNVSILSYFGEGSWTGTIESIRYGTDRVMVGDYIVAAPPDVMRRQLPVRIATARIAANWGDTLLTSYPFCNAGKSMEIRTL